MHLQKVQEILNTKRLLVEYTEENSCDNMDFMFRGLKFHAWEYEDHVWDAETMCLRLEEVRMRREIMKR